MSDTKQRVDEIKARLAAVESAEVGTTDEVRAQSAVRRSVESDFRFLLALVEEREALLRLARGVVERGPRFTDRHMEAAADSVVEELRRALAGEGI